MEKLLSISLAVLVTSFVIANGQEIGTEICACSPRSYEFTLDFSLTCPPVNITLGDSVEATACIVSPFGNPSVTDLVPVSVEGIDILELGQNLRVMTQTDVDDALVDGDKFTYTSVVADPNNIMAVQQVPRALQINTVGLNAQGDKIINVFIVTFTNDCGSYPLFQEGQSGGWTRFTGLGPGSPELCSAVPPILDPAPSEPAPVVSPTVSPAESPVEATPTGDLVPPSSFIAPSEVSPQAPIISGPTAFPMQMLIPTIAPTVEKTEEAAPVVSPTVGPIDFPVEATPTGDLVPLSPFIAPSVASPQAPVTDFPIQQLTPTIAPTMEETEEAVVPSPEASGSKETDAPLEEADPVETGAPIGPAEPDTDIPTPKPTPGTVTPVAEEVPTDAPIEIEEDDMDLPTIGFMSMSMSMSMSMPEDELGGNLLENLAVPRTREIEFGEWRTHRNTKDVKDKKSEKSGNMLKYLKAKVDKAKSTKIEKALKGIKAEKAEKDYDGVRIANRLRNGYSRLRV